MQQHLLSLAMEAMDQADQSVDQAGQYNEAEQEVATPSPTCEAMFSKLLKVLEEVKVVMLTDSGLTNNRPFEH